MPFIKQYRTTKTQLISEVFTMASNLLHRLSVEQGQSPWVDNLKRSYLADGTLAKLVERGVRGVTSNPTIFQKAIAGSHDYDAQLAELVKAGQTVEDAYWIMAIDDVRGACDVLAAVASNSKGVDGYVSLEVSPTLAASTEGTTLAARSLHTRVERSNLMVKIPATAQGIGAIQQMITEGRDINVTLIFSLDRYAAVIEAYLAGLEAYAAGGATDLSTVASVASFFISRVDSEVDKRLGALGTPEAQALVGKAAISQGVLAYQLFLNRFSGPRWERLAALGARPQRPLWASTSTKNPSFPDTLYVDSLIGPNSVNTLPEPTLEAFDDHGNLQRSVDATAAIADAHHNWAALAGVGIDMDEVAEVLEREGVASFAKSFEDLLATMSARAVEFLAE
jgi:transaldolase